MNDRSPRDDPRSFKSILEHAGGVLGFGLGAVGALLFVEHVNAERWVTITCPVVVVCSVCVHWWLGGFIGVRLDRVREGAKQEGAEDG